MQDTGARCQFKMSAQDAGARCQSKMPEQDAGARCWYKMPAQNVSARCRSKMPMQDTGARCRCKMPELMANHSKTVAWRKIAYVKAIPFMSQKRIFRHLRMYCIWEPHLGSLSWFPSARPFVSRWAKIAFFCRAIFDQFWSSTAPALYLCGFKFCFLSCRCPFVGSSNRAVQIAIGPRGAASTTTTRRPSSFG